MVSSGSNQLADTTGSLVRTYVYDAGGRTTAYGSNTYSYSNRGRMSGTNAGCRRSISGNAIGQLYEKSGTPGTTYLMYDEAGHLIGEYNGTGGLVEETVWLGDIP